MSFAIGFTVGWIVGVIMACFFLAKKNLEKMKKAEDKITDSIGLAKSAYNYYSKTPEERVSKETEGENE